MLSRALELGIYGTKARSTIRLPSCSGIAAIVDQQFELAAQIADRGLLPIVETEVLIESPEKEAAEAVLLAASQVVVNHASGPIDPIAAASDGEIWHS